jgi:peptidoglycan/LPS O-acetylase OafA/YrhL
MSGATARVPAGTSWTTIGEKLAPTDGRTTGFDYLRLVLAVAIVCAHSLITSYGESVGDIVWHLPLRPVCGLFLPMFFGLSGFLVSGSLFRTTSLRQFLFLRVIRIYPALGVEVLVSAFLIGPLLTIVPLGNYFSSPLFFSYLLNMTGNIHYILPGLFETNPYPNIVNMQLWTIPYEIAAYLGLAALGLMGMKRHDWFAPVATVALMLLYFVVRVLVKKEWALIAIAGGLPGELLLACFLAGISIYIYRDRMPWSYSLCVLSGLASALLIGFIPFGDFVVAPFVAYFTVSLGVLNPRKVWVLRHADYSYGIYLYGFVIQQAFAACFPWAREWWLNILFCVPAATAVAALSWHYVEKPAMRLRKYLNFSSPPKQTNVDAGQSVVRSPGFLDPALAKRVESNQPAAS